MVLVAFDPKSEGVHVLLVPYLWPISVREAAGLQIGKGAGLGGYLEMQVLLAADASFLSCCGVMTTQPDWRDEWMDGMA